MKILFLFFLPVLFISCKQTKNSIKTPPINVSKENNIKVNFISIGSGIEKNGIQKLETLISQFETDNNVDLILVKKEWGREGEKECCIDCSAISANKKMELKLAIEKLFKDSNLVRLFVDVICG